MPPSSFHVFLVRPSKYDDEGFVIRHWRAVVPSNSLACLYALTEDVRRRRELGNVELKIHVVDEAVDKLPLNIICRLNRRSRERVLVCLVGVQTNQVCRATDIALALRREQVPVMIGGFHVSGMLSMFPAALSPELQQLVDAGVCVVAGEVEHRWADLLRDALNGKLKAIYNFLDDPPDLSDAPRPVKHKQFTAKHVHSNYGTMDCSRGCPFNCSFCTIINVQGRKSRYRSPECIVGTVRQAFRDAGVNLYFFTDDNFARNPAWEEIFDRLTALREKEGIAIEFVIQADMAAHKIRGFIDKAVRAGCCTVFIGMESLNPRNLQAAGKTQNRVQEYRAAMEAWYNARVTTLVGYIIGFPYDTEESVRCDIRRLINEVQPDQASFFMMAPLPGSRDHRSAIEDGIPMDADYNRFDCFHETTSHPLMKEGAWARVYAEAWRRFYSLENMKAILSRTHAERYWDVFFNLLWYKHSVANEGMHPMLSGVFRWKDRASRRACFPQEGRLAHLRRRIPEIYRLLRGTLRVALEMEELWLATRKRSETEVRVAEELAVRAGRRGGSVRCLLQTRRDLAKYWIGLRRQLRQGRIGTVLRIDRLALNAWREARLAAGFLVALNAAGSVGKGIPEHRSLQPPLGICPVPPADTGG
jgi:radical SAM superfamily enzyme YgiQ (UPF0313 family)